MPSFFSNLGLRKCAWLAGGVWLLYLLVKIVLIQLLPFANQIDTVIFLLMVAILAALLFVAAFNTHGLGEVVQIGWFLLAASFVFEVMGELIDILSNSISKDPYASLAYLLGYSLRSISIVLIPAVYIKSTGRFRRFFNTKTIIIGAVFTIWLFFVLPIFASGGSDFIYAYATLFFWMCFAVLDLLTKQRSVPNKAPGYWLAASVGLDILAATLLVAPGNLYSQQAAFIRDALWIASYLAMMLAAISQLIFIHTAKDPEIETPKSSWFSKLEPYLPTLWILGVCLIYLWSYFTQQNVIFQTFMAGIGVLIVVLAVRQVDAANENAILYQAAQQEIAQRKTVEEQMHYDARHDLITGLPNRMDFTEQLQRSLDRARRQPRILSAVLFLDLDRFKLINDSFGHSRGDQLLGIVAERLKACVRLNDSVARFGGDEFAILVEDIEEAAEAVTVADCIQSKLNDPFDLDGHKANTSASIGIAFIKPEYEQPEDILRDADIAMYGAKRNGKARSEIFSLELNSRNQIQLLLESELQQAVKNQEFLLYYQPTVSLPDQKISAAEALLRWRHPYRGLLLPGEFMQMAEETGLILTIGSWVLQTACTQAVQWGKNQNKCIKISVNLSLRQFYEPSLIRLVQQTLQDTGLEPQCLELEISEQTALRDIEMTARILRSLGSFGIHTSIDGFGTSYAILNSLKHLSLTTLKIRQPTSKSPHPDDSEAAMISVMISTAQSLHFNVVAERVETPSQLAQLHSQHIDHAQGYIICPPVGEAEFTRLLVDGLLTQVNIPLTEKKHWN